MELYSAMFATDAPWRNFGRMESQVVCEHLAAEAEDKFYLPPGKGVLLCAY